MDRVFSRYGQCSTMLCITWDVVLLEPSYGPGFVLLQATVAVKAD